MDKIFKKKNKNIDAIILCAGRGKRMRYETKYKAKPLIKIQNKALLEINLKKLSVYGIKNCVINTSYKHNTVYKFIKNFSYKNKYPKISFSFEKNRLETGGGIKNALKYFNSDSILAINGDSLLTNNPYDNPIKKLCSNFDYNKMDILLLLIPKSSVVGYSGNGDFVKTTKKNSCVIKRSGDKNSLVFTGWQIVKKELFEHINLNNFSLNVLYDIAEKKNKLYGITHAGEFLHMSNPKSYLQVENFLNKNNVKL